MRLSKKNSGDLRATNIALTVILPFVVTLLIRHSSPAFARGSSASALPTVLRCPVGASTANDRWQVVRSDAMAILPFTFLFKAVSGTCIFTPGGNLLSCAKSWQLGAKLATLRNVIISIYLHMLLQKFQNDISYAHT